ncbi:hypothetical protein D3C73_1048360 [compost metagenome]
MVAVDDHPGPGRVGQGRQIGDAVEQAAGAEEDLADEDQVVPARPRRCDEPLGEGLERGQGHAGDDGLAGLLPAFRLAPKGVELAVGGQDAHGRPVDRRDDAQQDVVGVGGEDQPVGRGQAQFAGDVALSLGDDLAEDQVPFAVGEAIGLGPGLDLAVEAGVGPQVMAVGGEMQPFGIEAERAREQGLVAHDATLTRGRDGVTGPFGRPCASSLPPRWGKGRDGGVNTTFQGEGGRRRRLRAS